MTQGSLIKLENIVKRYVSADGVETAAVLDGLSLELQAGRSLAVVGPSGCGKSTLLNIMGALDKPTSGRVIFDGRGLDELEEADLAEIRRRRIGFIFQNHHLLPQCTVLENVLVPTLSGLDRSLLETAEARALKLLDRVGLSDRLDQRPGRLSGGQAQRVAVVRALINQPAILLADEPTGLLDRQNAREIVGLLAELNAQNGLTVVMVTHSMELAESMSQVMELRDGKPEILKDGG